MASLIAASPLAIIGLDRQGRVRMWNPAAQRLFGWREQEVLGRPSPTIPEGGRAEFRRLYRQALAGQCCSNLTVRRRRKDGLLIDVAVWSAPWHDTNGRLIGAIAILADVTEHHRTAEAAQIEQEFRKAIENSMAAGILTVDLLGRITYANPAFCELAGWPREKLVGWMPPYLFWPPEDRPYMQKLARTILSGKAPRKGVEVRLRRRNGRRVDALLFISPLRDSQGQLAGWVGSLYDITDRKRAERALSESERRYRGLVESQQDLIVRVDAQGRFTFVNDVYCAVAGKTREQLLGRPFGPMVCEDDLPATLEAMKGLYLPPYRISIEQRMKTPDGFRWIAWEDALIRDEQGQIIEIQAVGRDITQRRQAEEQVRLYQEQLRSMGSELALAEERERRRIATDLHDDIGQALALAQLKLEDLRRSCSRHDAHRPVQEVQQILSRAIQSTRSLTYQLSPPILYDLGLEAALEWLAEQMREHYGLQVVLQRDEQPKPLPELLRVVVFRAARELLINVAKHAKVPQASLAVASRDGHVQVTVADQGIGFDPSQIGSGRKRGFGLFSIRERLEHLGGRMRVESAPGRGTRVVLVSPLPRE